MAEDGSEKRQRTRRYTVRFSAMEDAVLRMNADRAGLTIASYLRRSALDMPAPAGGRRPPVDRRLAAELIAVMGDAATAFRTASELADPRLLETTINDFNEYRLIVLQSMGRAP